MDLGLERLLIRRADAGELGDLALPGLFVETFRVALLGDLDGDVDPNLDKRHARLTARMGGLVELTRQVTVGAVRTDEAGDGDGARIGEELGHFGDAPDVLFAVLGREAQVFVQAEPNVVAVEAVGGQVVWFPQKGLLQGDGDGRFATCRQARQPDGQAGLTTERGTNAVSQGSWMICNVAITRKQTVGDGERRARCNAVILMAIMDTLSKNDSMQGGQNEHRL